MKKLLLSVVLLTMFTIVIKAEDPPKNTFCTIVGKVVGAAAESGVVGSFGFEKDPDYENMKAVEKDVTEACESLMDWLFSGSSNESESSSSNESESSSSDEE